jgi:formylglycine-generating enzyme required for sulfatase activity/tRNA A-37 threonylcarbamoyl transferase component Bud32
MSTDTTSWVGQHLSGGRYQVTATLGAGGMGVAYRARDTQLGREVVIKVPRRAMLDDPDFAPRFAREARSLAQLSHAHIVKIHDVGTHDGFPFLILEFLTGGSLGDRLRRDGQGRQIPRPAAELQTWLQGVAEVLDFIHRQKYLHRDVKPANILFDGEGHVFLSDFGIVKALTANGAKKPETVMTGTGMVIGTPQYLAPELIFGEACDGRADQYSLAATVYEMLSGRVPVDGATFGKIVQRLSNETIPPVHALVPALPAALGEALQRGLARNPQERYADCVSLARAVLATLAGGTVPQGAVAAEPGAVPTSKAVSVCPACRKKISLPVAALGKRVRCRGCGQEFQTKRPAAVQEVLNAPTVAPPPRAQALPATALYRRMGGCGLVGALAVVGLLMATLVVGCWAVLSGGWGGRSPAPLLDCTGEKGRTAAEVKAAQQAWANYLGRQIEEEDAIAPGVKMQFVLVPPGKFVMGSPEGEEGRNNDEVQHEVTITRPVYLGKYEVTQAQYEALGNENKSKFQGADLPVENVSWDEADTFARELTQKKGGGKLLYRLPTEAEWEYACRGGRSSSSPFGIGDGTSLSSSQANFDGNSPYGGAPKREPLNKTCAVGSYPANALGLHDMHGNVWEWCWDRHGDYPSGKVTDPKGPEEGSHRVSRGGSWLNGARCCRAAFRSRIAPDYRYVNLGFRLARVPPSGQ